MLPTVKHTAVLTAFHLNMQTIVMGFTVILTRPQVTRPKPQPRPKFYGLRPRPNITGDSPKNKTPFDSLQPSD